MSARTGKGAGTLIGAGGKAYEWLKRVLGFYGTAVTVVQLVPAVIALVLVFVSPTAWLSATLRRWVAVGAAVGAVAGIALLARVAGPRSLRRTVRGGPARSGRLSTLGWWGLGMGVVAATAFRFHLAVVDVAFVNSVPLLTPLFDFYLGGGRLSAGLYNALAAVLAGLSVLGLSAGAPAALLRWREASAARKALAEEGGPLAALDRAAKALEAAKAAIEAARAGVLESTETPPTSGPGRPGLPGRSSGARRPRR